jgi:uncharacterized protein (TIGR02300 family)
MARIDLSRFGTKFGCYSCGCKFYDMNRADPICPKCGANQKNAPAVDLSAVESVAAKRPPKPPRPQRPVIEDVEEGDFDAEEEGVAAGEEEDFEFDEDLDFGDEPELDEEEEEEEVP